MLGRARPWEAVSASVPKEAPAGIEWSCTGSSAAGEEIWECVFPANKQADEFIATVLLDPGARTARILYAGYIKDGDRLPKVPSHVRRMTEAFRKRLLSSE
jgi:hypothetical protein